MKTCKVITVFLGPRRTGPTNNATEIDDLVKMFKYHIWCEKNIDPGVPMDTIIVSHGCQRSEDEQWLNSLNNSNNFSGKFIVIHKPNVGGSYGGHNQAVEEFIHDQIYDYWMFTEDDVIFNHQGYLKLAIDQFEKSGNPKLAVVSYLYLAIIHPHSTGAICVIPKAFVEEQFTKKGFMGLKPNSKADINDMSAASQNEQEFTYFYHKKGYAIETLKTAANYPINYKDVEFMNIEREKRKDDSGSSYLFRIGKIHPHENIGEHCFE